MRKKIFKSNFLTSLFVLLASSALIMGVLFNCFEKNQESQLRSQLSLAVAAVESEGESYLKKTTLNNERLTLIDTDGKGLFDSENDVSKMENHGSREEVRQAMAVGYGESVRYSSTMMKETCYIAQRLDNNKVLRISADRLTIWSLALSMIQPFLIVFIISAAFSLLLSDFAARQISEPLNKLDLEHPIENDTYDEIAPLLRKLDHEIKEVRTQKEQLETNKDEFNTVITNMNEGLVMLNEEHTVISINHAAMNFYGADEHAFNHNFLLIERDIDVNAFLSKAEKEGSVEWTQEKNGRMYQLYANAVNAGSGRRGLIILIFDITEKAFAERNRREFTANVSHELKTPLHSIKASAELIESGLAKPEDVPRFAHVISKETERLVTLVEDIIRLSKLDEKTDIPLEQIELKSMVSEEISRLIPTAEEKEVTLIQKGVSVSCTASRQLMQEIIYNLIENAIKYNKQGGSVTVTTGQDQDCAILRVKDTGIGIAKEDQPRVFERFYRVDKSRSRESGGTGLGLSIVKHAVQYLNGRIEMNSEQGKGTEITIRIPINQNKSI